MKQLITPMQGQALVDSGHLLIDVRTPAEFEQGHPASAVNIPVMLGGPGGMMPNPEFLQVVQRLVVPTRGVVLCCASGARGSRAMQLLTAAGYAQVENIDGGFAGRRDSSGQVAAEGWSDSGLPVSHDLAGRDYASMRDKAREA